MQMIYLDNNATTRPATEVVAAVREMLEEQWGNPSSVHRFGQGARQRVELARAAVAGLIGCRDRELVFTSGGTESNHLALRGVLGGSGVWGLGFRQSQEAEGGGGVEGAGGGWMGSERVLITTKIEHSAIRDPAEALQSEGVRVVYLPVDHNGQVRAEDLSTAVEENLRPGSVVLASIQWANNETGVVQAVEELGEVVRRYRSVRAGGVGSAGEPSSGSRVYFHVDATQAVGKIFVDVKRSGVDLMTLSGHKFHGPKGVGGLFVRSGVRLRSVIRGGQQERELRGGTENTPGIVGMGVAAELAVGFLGDAAGIARLEAMRDRFERGIVRAVPHAVIHSKGARARLWNTTNIGFPKLEAEAILLGLSERGVCASAGAACSSGSLEPSPVLLAMGIPEQVAHGSIRFSISRLTTEQEIDEAIRIVPEVVERLRGTLPG